MTFLRYYLFALLLASQVICLDSWAKPLSDGITGSISVFSRSGIFEIVGQQNLHPRFGLLVGAQKFDYLTDSYKGWEIGSNLLLARILSQDWQANSVITFGFSGMKGPVHDHSGVWAKLDLDWERRDFLVAWSGSIYRSINMPKINDSQVRLGYSPFRAEMDRLQPWLLLSRIDRTGTSGFPYFAGIRLLTQKWWLEVGTSLTLNRFSLGAAITL